MWYGDCYLQFMGIPVALKESAGAPYVDDSEAGGDGGDVSASLNGLHVFSFSPLTIVTEFLRLFLFVSGRLSRLPILRFKK